MRVVVGHKGGRGYRVRVTGSAAHSSLAPRAVNAIEYAAELILFLRGIAKEWASRGRTTSLRPAALDLSTGLIAGGTAINIVPASCELVFEFRHLAAVDAEAVTARIREFARDVLEPRMRAVAPESGIEFDEDLRVSRASTSTRSTRLVTFVKSLAERNDHGKVAFGTEGGLFRERAGVAAVVCGPGSIEQAHKADEYVEAGQLELCGRFLRRLLDRLEEGPLAFPR